MPNDSDCRHHYDDFRVEAPSKWEKPKISDPFGDKAAVEAVPVPEVTNALHSGDLFTYAYEHLSAEVRCLKDDGVNLPKNYLENSRTSLQALCERVVVNPDAAKGTWAESHIEAAFQNLNERDVVADQALEQYFGQPVAAAT